MITEADSGWIQMEFWLPPMICLYLCIFELAFFIVSAVRLSLRSSTSAAVHYPVKDVEQPASWSLTWIARATVLHGHWLTSGRWLTGVKDPGSKLFLIRVSGHLNGQRHRMLHHPTTGTRRRCSQPRMRELKLRLSRFQETCR